MLATPGLAAQIELDPSTPWNIDGTPSGCTLRRGFGSGAVPLTLSIQRYEPGDEFELVVEGDELASVTPTTALRVSYGGRVAPRDPQAFKTGTTMRDGRQQPVATIFMSSTLRGDATIASDAMVTPEMEAQATSVKLGWRSTELVLKTGPLNRPLASMRACTDALVASWGLDPAVQKTLSRRPEPIGPKGWAARIDYPFVGTGSSEARVNVRMLVGADGKPTDCKVLRSYSDSAFDAAACRSLKAFARFKPALDTAGKPVPSYFTVTIIWSLSGR